jgi:hypothetical protein
VIDGDALAEELLVRFERGEPPPDWAGRDVKLWAVALDRLIVINAHAAAAWAVVALRRLYPDLSLLSRLELLLQTAPGLTGDDPYDAFLDDPLADVQVARRQGASEALLVFAGVGGRVGMPVALAHRWFGQLQVHVVYLRDAHQQAFNEGVRSLGTGYEATLDRLWRLADELNARAILTYGNSVGGYAALRYGLDLRARSIVGFSAATSMTPPLSPLDGLAQRRMRVALDLKPFFQAATPPPRTLLVFGADHDMDSRHARHLEELPSVSLEPLAGSSRHEAVVRSVELGRFGEFLARLAAPG